MSPEPRHKKKNGTCKKKNNEDTLQVHPHSMVETIVYYIQEMYHFTWANSMGSK